MQEVGWPMIELEKFLMQNSNGIRSISRSIKEEIEVKYNFKFNNDNLYIAPLGLNQLENSHNIYNNKSHDINILFCWSFRNSKRY